MFGFDEGFEQELRQPKFEDVRKNSQLHKGKVLCKRKTIHELLNDEKQRLTLPNIAATSPKTLNNLSNNGLLMKGYTFTPNNAATKGEILDEDEVEKILLLTPLNTSPAKKSKKTSDRLQSREKPSQNNQFSDIDIDGNTKNVTNSNHCVLSSASCSHQTEKHEIAEKEEIKVDHKQDSHLSHLSTNYYSTICHGDNLFIKQNTVKEYKANVYVLRPNPCISADIGASMCTQSFNSLCTELTMFKDTAKTLAKQTPRAKIHRREQAARYNSINSDSVKPTFTIFKNHKRSVLSRTQKSRNTNDSTPQSASLIRRATAASCNETSVHNNGDNERETEEIPHTCRRESAASEKLNDCCFCVKQPFVQFKLKDKYDSNMHTSTGPDKSTTRDYQCYKPQQLHPKKVQMEFQKTAHNSKRAITLPRIPCKPADVDTYVVHQRSLLEPRHSVSSNPEVSPRELPNVGRTSHEWPENSELSHGRRAVISYKCNEWVNRWL